MKTILSILLILMLCGCDVPKSKLALIKLGQSQEEVSAIIGQPSTIRKDTRTEEWFYAGFRRCYFQFENNKLIKIETVQ